MAGAFRAKDEPILARESQDAYALGVTAHQMLTRDDQPPLAMEVCQHSISGIEQVTVRLSLRCRTSLLYFSFLAHH